MYHKLLTRKILDNIPNQPQVNNHLLKELLLDCYRYTSFSTFPYIANKLNSKQSIQYMNSGNCISLSLYLMNRLKQLNIISYLIPCTIPSFYKRNGYLDISHVSLLVPKSKNSIFILDPAFYFLTPIHINLKSNKINTIDSISLYDDKKTYIEPVLKQLMHDTKYNNYQTILKNTLLCECYYTFNKSDKWNYYLVEILNPDLAISTFYINIIQKPFITTTFVDKDEKCKMFVYLRIIDNNNNNNNNMKLSIMHKSHYEGSIKDCPDNVLDDIQGLVSKFFIGNVKNYIRNYENFSNTIYD